MLTLEALILRALESLDWARRRVKYRIQARQRRRIEERWNRRAGREGTHGEWR